MRAKDIGEMKRFMNFELCYTELHDAMSSSGIMFMFFSKNVNTITERTLKS